MHYVLQWLRVGYGIAILLTLGGLLTTGRGADAPAPARAEGLGGLTPSPTCTPDWQQVSSPNVGSGNNYLYSVAAVAANDIWAVGYYTTTTNLQQTLTVHWDG